MISRLIADSGSAAVCRAAAREYEGSVFYRGLHRLGLALGAGCRRSVTLGILLREGLFARAWRDSLTCRVLTFLLSLPGVLLHALYRAGKDKFDRSPLMALAFDAGAGAALAESWLILALWVIPFAQWDNAYHLMAFVLVYLLLCLRQMRNGVPLRLDRVGFYLPVMALAVILSIPLSRYPELSGRYLRYHIICMLCVLATVSAPRGPGDLKRLAACGSTVILVSAVWAVVQRIQGVEIVAAYVDKTMNAGMPGRVQSYFDNPNTYAQVLVMLLPLSLGLLAGGKRLSTRVFALVAFAAGVLALGMTYSRASWIGLVLALAVFLMLWKPKLIPPLLVLVFLCIPLLPDTIINRILTIGQASSDSTVTSRFPLYEAGWEIIRTRPLTGVGLGTDAVREYIIDKRIYSMMVYYSHLHDIFIQLWAESGVLAVLGFTGAMLWGLKSMARETLRKGDKTVKCLAAACCGSVCGSLLVGIVDYIWAYPRVMCIFWFVFALGLCCVRLLREGPAEEGSV